MMGSPPPKPARLDWEPWDPVNFDDMGGGAIKLKRAERKPASPVSPGAEQGTHATRAVAMHREGYEAGYEAGFASARTEGLKAGHAAAEAELRQAAAQLAQAVARVDAGAADLERAVADELLALAIEIARKVVNQAIVVQPAVILETIREALAQMPSQHTMIRLSTADAALLRTHGGEPLIRAGHRIHEDPQLARGDVVIEAGGAHLDCRIRTRWQRVIGTLDQGTPWLVAEETELS